MTSSTQGWETESSQVEFRCLSPFSWPALINYNSKEPNPGQIKPWPEPAQCRLNDCAKCERVFFQIRSHLKRVQHTFYLQLTLDTSIRGIFVCPGLITQGTARPPVPCQFFSRLSRVWCIWTRRISESQRHPTLQTRAHTAWKPDKSKKLTTFSTHTHTRARPGRPHPQAELTPIGGGREWAKGCSYLCIYPAAIRLRSAAVAQTQSQKTSVCDPDPPDSAGEFCSWTQQQKHFPAPFTCPPTEP